MDGRKIMKGNTVAIVTGAAGGIGRAVVKDLVQDDIHVIAFDQSKSGLVDLQRAYGDLITALQVDVSEWDEVTRALSEILPRFPTPRYLVCGAGINPLMPYTGEVPEEFYDKLLSTNLKGTFTFCRVILPLMAAAGTGSVVNIASVSGLIGWGGSSVYSATKGGVIALTRALATEYGPSGIRVNCVCPGSIRTDMVLDNLKERNDLESGLERIAQLHPLKRIGEPHEVSSVVKFLLSEQASFISGVSLPIDGAMSVS
jgi:NAD(P)-dependent dehydrogenase (short-subunit alcohol dehydrogenase family)